MQNSVFTARRWDRATGSTSTVGGVREKSEDSAGDSCGAGASHGGAVDGPVDSTQAQHRAGAGGTPAATHFRFRTRTARRWRGAAGGARAERP